MELIIISIITGFIGVYLGGMLDSEIFAIIFGIVGFFSPSIYILDKIYRKTKNEE